jgi:hypothetical protein
MTLQLMLKGKRNRNSNSRSPKIPREQPAQNPSAIVVDSTQPTQQQLLQQVNQISHGRHQHQPSSENISPVFGQHFSPDSEIPVQQGGIYVPPQGTPIQPAEYYMWEQMLRGVEPAGNEQVPVWMSDHSLGGHSFQQYGMDAFLIPADYAAQMW